MTEKQRYLIGTRAFAGKKRTPAEQEKLSKGIRKRLSHNKKQN